MKTGLILVLIGLLLVFFAYWTYKKSEENLLPIKQDDLVAYYLELVYRLLPAALWCVCLGIVLCIVGIIVVIIHIPIVF